MVKSNPDRWAEALARTLGLPRSSSEERVDRAFRELADHIRQRRNASSDEGFRGARDRELERLKGWMASPRPHGTSRSVGTSGRRAWLLVFIGALVGSSITAALLLWGPHTGQSSPSGSLGSLNPDGLIAVRAHPAESELEVLLAASEEVVVRGLANGATIPLPPQLYRLRVRNAGCPDEWTREVEIKTAERKEFAPRLCQGQARVRVESNVDRGRVLIDGHDRGQTGSTEIDLEVGNHQIRVEKPGHAPWEGKIKLLPDQKLTLHAELSKSRPPGPSPRPSAEDPLNRIAEPESPRGSRETGGAESEAKRRGLGGSKSWHDAVKEQLLLDFDRNGSRSLDSREEIQGIPCAVWQELEASYETGGLRVEMTHLYGFDGSEAPANTLGVTFGMRGYAYDRMKSCGLKTRR